MRKGVNGDSPRGTHSFLFFALLTSGYFVAGKAELIKTEKGHGVCLSEGHGGSGGGKLWREESQLKVQNGKERKGKEI